MQNPYLIIGQILRPQGVRGEVKVRPITDDPQRFVALTQAYLLEEETYRLCSVHCTRVHKGFAYLLVNDAQDREAAEAFRGAYLCVDRQNAIPLPEDTNFICDLIGCRVQDEQGNEIGTLREVLQPGAADVYVLDTPRGELLFPALKRVVLHVDTNTQRMVLDARVLEEVAVYQD